MKKYSFDFSAKTKPYPHQAEAIEFIKDKEIVPLFDEQGLGKTKIVLDALCFDIESGLIDGALIICKKSLLCTWEDEIKKHSHLSSITLRGSATEKGYKFLGFAHFYLVNYDSLLTELERIKMFLKVKNLAIVLDESHKIKNPLTKTAQAIFDIKSYAKKRIIITGTPIANRPEDLWAQFYFLDDGKLLGADYEHFKSKYCPVERRGKLSSMDLKKISTLKTILNKVSIRRLKDNVLELPEKRYQDVYVTLKGQQQELYESLRKNLFIEIQNLDGQQIIDEATNILKKLLRLTQIASNPSLIDAHYKEEPIKFLKMDEIAKDIISRNEKVVVWTSFVDNIRELRRRYKSFNPLMLFGEIPIEERNRIVKKFQNYEDYKILIANPSAAREGLTLTKANNAIYLDRNFNLVDYLQSQDRIHRISQTKVCNIIKIIAKETVDEYIDDILFRKQDVAQYIQGDKVSMAKEREYLTKEELFNILGRR